MNWRDVPPAGNRILLQPGGDLPQFAGYRALWLQSGTASLAFALQAARARAQVTENPEVVLPAYGCPDLVAAADHAGLRAVLADIHDDDAAYDPDSLRAALSERTVAVVAVNFLGIRERLDDIRELLRAHPRVSLIEDDAQWFPERDDCRLEGDAVVFSFGRGKPVSLLGGGAVLLRDSLAILNPSAGSLVAQAGGASPDLAIRAYNLLLSPWLYPIASRNPLLRLGATRYHALESIHPMDARRQALLPANLARYRARVAAVSARYDAVLGAPRSLSLRLAGRTGRLLRYPVLCDEPGQRDQWLARLRRAGLGASALYERPLATIEGVSVARAQSSAAARFAARLLTLPVHEGVDERVIVRIARILTS